MMFFSEVLSDGYEMTSAPNTFVVQQGWILLGICGAMAVLGLWLTAGSRERVAGEYAAPGG